MRNIDIGVATADSYKDDLSFVIILEDQRQLAQPLPEAVNARKNLFSRDSIGAGSMKFDAQQ